MPDHRTALKRSVLCGLVGSLLLLAGCATHHNAPATTAIPEETPFLIERDLRFSPDYWPEVLFADLYLPGAQSTAQAHPVVLMVHGGGWQRRSREDMAWIAEELASHGYAVMNIDYRFAPQYTFPAQLYDLQVARQWLNRNAAHSKRIGSIQSSMKCTSGAMSPVF